MSSDEKIRGIVKRTVELVRRPDFDDYDEVAQWAHELQESVREIVKHQIVPSLNQKLAEFPQSTLLEKRALCHWLTEELASFGLCVKCPKTGLPANIHVDQGDNVTIGRFQIQLKGNENDKKRTLSATRLFPIDVIDHPARTEPFRAYWSQKARERRDPGRGK